MADKEKKKKPKKKEEAAAPAEEAASPKAETPKSPSDSARASRGSRKAKRTGSSVFSMFTQKQLAEFKEAFQLMDHDKDGIISRNDLRHCFDQVGRLATDKELDEMLGEASGPINFTQLLQLFASRMSGGSADDDDVILKAFNAFDNGQGKIDGDRLRKSLMTWGDKFTQKDINDAWDLMYIDDKGLIDLQSLTDMLLGRGEDEEGGEA